MGLKPIEVEACTLRDFSLMYTGYKRRQDREWDRTRHVMAFIMNFSGWGAKDFQDPKTIWPLDFDNENEARKITTLKQALALLKEFE